MTNSLERTQGRGGGRGGRREREERKILGRQDERLGQVPGCRLANMWDNLLLPKSLLAICRTALQVASRDVSLQILLFFGLSVSLVNFPTQHKI